MRRRPKSGHAGSRGTRLTYVPGPFSHPANLVVCSAAGYSPKDYLKAGAVVVAVIAAITLTALR